MSADGRAHQVWARVVDASALAAVLFGEPEGGEVGERLGGRLLVAPALLRFELANVCWQKIQRHLGQREALLAAHALAEDLEILEVDVEFVEVVDLAEKEGLTAYDASYLALARALDLVTLDRWYRISSPLEGLRPTRTAMPDDRFDAFLSYARADAGEWAEVLAGNLERLGFRVFFDRWEIAPGDVLVHELDRGLLNSAAGVLVVTPAALASAWVQQEYAAMMTRAVAGEQRLIPALFLDAEMPPLLAARVWVDFRGADGPEYLRRVQELAAALRGEKGARPPRGEALAAPPGTGFRAAGPIRRILRLGWREVLWAGGPEEVRAEARKLGGAEEEDLWLLARARRRASSGAPAREAANAATAPEVVELHASLLEVGTSLTRAFLPGAVGAALRAAVEEATGQGASLEIAVQVQEEIKAEKDDGVLASLPWETLRVPAGDGEGGAAGMGPPLVLHPNVELYRAVSGLGPSPAIQVPGPLRILVAIGSPETQRGGELLDYEAELGRILEAVEPARRAGKAYVKILHRGTVAAIRAALAERRYHVLYVSCHAGPGCSCWKTRRDAPTGWTAPASGRRPCPRTASRPWWCSPAAPRRSGCLWACRALRRSGCRALRGESARRRGPRPEARPKRLRHPGLRRATCRAWPRGSSARGCRRSSPCRRR